MRTIRDGAGLRAALDDERARGRVVGLVPTMGALHEGHLSLLRHARETCDVVVVSIFVNPSQFLPGEDFDAYPRDEERDLRLAEEEKTDLAFVPTILEMYPRGIGGATSVRVSGPHGVSFEGASRPQHFDGVATVVAKLLGLVQPEMVFFGQKDAQQLAVVRRIVTDLFIATRVIACPTVREPDGLALSSRNVYLTPDERKHAPVLWRALTNGREAILAGGSPKEGAARVKEVMEAEPTVALDYAAAVDPDTFVPARGDRCLLVVAARIGATRLIDNLLVERGD